jgi:hypothetical protein
MRFSPSLLAGFVVKIKGLRPVPLPPPPAPVRTLPATLRKMSPRHYSSPGSTSGVVCVVPLLASLASQSRWRDLSDGDHLTHCSPTTSTQVQSTTYQQKVRDEGLEIGQVRKIR